MLWWKVKKLNSLKPDVRIAAVREVAGTKGVEAVEMIAPLLADADVEVRRTVAEVLGGLATPEARNHLFTASRDVSPMVRETAVQALSAEADKQIVPFLVQTLRDPNSRVAWHAAKGLEKAGWQPPTPADTAWLCVAQGDYNRATWNGVAAIEALSFALKNDNAANRRSAVEALSGFGDVRAGKALTTVLKDPETMVRMAAIESLGERRDPQFAEALGKCMKDKLESIRIAVLQALVKIGPPDILNRLEDSLKDASSDVRKAAVESLGKLRDPRALPTLEGLLGDKAAEIRAAAAESMARIGGELALERLILALADPDATTSKAIEKTLSGHVQRWAASNAALRTIPELKRRLKSGEEPVRRAATEILGKISKANTASEPGTPSSPLLQLITKGLRCKLTDIRLAAIAVIAQTKPPEAATLLRQVLSDPDPAVQSAAKALSIKNG